MDVEQQKRQLIEEAKRRNPNLTRDQGRALLDEFDRRVGTQAGNADSGEGNILQSALNFLIPETSKIPQKVASGFEGAVFSQDQIPQNNQGNVLKSAEAAGKNTINMLASAARPALELGSFLVPVGKALKARAALGALSGGTFGAAQEGATPSDVLKTTGMGALFGPAAGAFGKAISPVTRKAGEKAVEGSKEVLTRSLGATQAQKLKFKNKTGMDIAEFLKKEGIGDNFADEGSLRLENLMEDFNGLATREGVNVPTKTLRQAFERPIKELSDSSIPSVKRKAQQLNEVVDNISAKYGDEIPLADLTQERRAFDALLADRQFGLSPAEANYLKSGRDTLQRLIQETTDQLGEKGKLKDLGRKISQYIEFNKIAERQSQKGGSGLLTLRGAILGAGGFAQGGLLGLAGGFLLDRAAKNPTVLRGTSEALEGIGQGLQRTSVPQVPENLMRLLRGAAESSVSPKRKPNNEQEDRFNTLRRVQQRQNEVHRRRPGLLP